MRKLIRDGAIFILAEVAQSYEGNIDTLVEISRRVCDSGVDGVMFQVVFADELAVPEYSHYKLFKSLEMSTSCWKEAIDVIHKKGKLAVGEIFGKKSADLIADLSIDAFKIHAADVPNTPFLRYLGKFRLPILLSAGGSQEIEISKAISALREGGVQDIVLLHGYQMCPTTIGDTHFNKVRYLEERFHLPVGYSDHIAGCKNNDVKQINEYAFFFPLIALGSGACLIEKHIILDRSKAWEDFESALSVEEFKRFVEVVRRFELSLGKKDLSLNSAEENYGKRAKKYIVAAQDISKNTLLSEELIAFKRIKNPEDGFSNMDEILDKKTAQDIKINSVISNSVLAGNLSGKGESL